MPLQIGFYITEAVRYEQLIFLSLFLLFLSFIPLSYPLSFLLSCFILSKYFVFLSVLVFITPFIFFLFFLPSFFPSASSSSRYCEHCSLLTLSLKVSGRSRQWLGDLCSGRLLWSSPCVIESCCMCHETHCSEV